MICTKTKNNLSHEKNAVSQFFYKDSSNVFNLLGIRDWISLPLSSKLD